MAKVIVGMSGGVDSSVTAHLLRNLGYEVEGVSLILYEARNKTGGTACCSIEARDSAADTAKALGISHKALDVRGAFIEKVVEPFVEAYKKGLTPNPCILCNKYIKFPMLLSAAKSVGAEFIATGHYAIVDSSRKSAVSGQQSCEEARCLRKGLDPKKDQSYVLYVLDRQQLERLILPLGGLTKADVRKIALSLNLPAAGRPESQEICFVENNDHNAFIAALDPDTAKPGPVMNREGRVIGTHKGVYAYTIGQRKGLNIQTTDPHFVTGIDPLNNIVYAGSRSEAMSRNIHVEGINWLCRPSVHEFRADVKIRSMMDARPAFITANGDAAEVIFDDPQWAPSPGQSAVFYDGDIVLGGGIISRESN